MTDYEDIARGWCSITDYRCQKEIENTQVRAERDFYKSEYEMFKNLGDFPYDEYAHASHMVGKIRAETHEKDIRINVLEEEIRILQKDNLQQRVEDLLEIPDGWKMQNIKLICSVLSATGVFEQKKEGVIDEWTLKFKCRPDMYGNIFRLPSIPEFMDFIEGFQ